MSETFGNLSIMKVNFDVLIDNNKTKNILIF